MNKVEIDSLENQRKKLRFRAWHRGTREMDLIMGSFADKYIHQMNAEELKQFDDMLQISDPELYSWYLGKETPPPEWQNKLTDQFLAHQII